MGLCVYLMAAFGTYMLLAAAYDLADHLGVFNKEEGFVTPKNKTRVFAVCALVFPVGLLLTAAILKQIRRCL